MSRTPLPGWAAITAGRKQTSPRMSGTDRARDSMAHAIGRAGASEGFPRVGVRADVCTDVMRPPISEPLNTLTNQPT
ncbi:hypothetical protein M2436_005876 [Streptomyces sp. HB372]|nr:hypothetical protein [Streptomyces sp. HB372]